MKRTFTILFASILFSLNAIGQHQFDYAYPFGKQGNIIEHIVGPNDQSYIMILPSNNTGDMYVDPKTRQTPVASPTSAQLYFVTVLNSDGSYDRSISFEVTLDSFFPTMKINAQGEIYVMGTFKDQAFLDPQALTTKTFDIPGQTGIFVAKYTTSGTLAYAKASVNPSGSSFPDPPLLTLINDTDFALSVTLPNVVDMSLGGTTPQNFGINGANRAFIGLYKTDGNYAQGFDLGSHAIFNSLASNSVEDVYAFGYVSNGSIDLDRSSSTVSLTKVNKARNFLVRFDNTLSYLDHIDYGEGSISASRLMKIDNNDSIFVSSNTTWESLHTDNTRDRLDLDNSSGVFEAVAEEARAVFLGRYAADLTFGGGMIFGDSQSDVLVKGLDVNNDRILFNIKTSAPVNIGKRGGSILKMKANSHGMLTFDRSDNLLGNEVIGFISSAKITSNNDIIYLGNSSGTDDLDTGSEVFRLTDIQSNLIGLFVAKATSCQGVKTESTVSVCSGETYTVGTNTYNESGSYIDLLESSMGCDSLVVTNLVYPAVALSASITNTTDITCHGVDDGTVTLQVAGGTAPYQFSIDGVAFTNLPDNSVVANVNPINNQPISIKDANGCMIMTNPITINEPNQLSAAVQGASSPTCNGGSDGEFTVSVSGGTGPFTYSIDGINFQNSPTFTNLVPDDYSVHVKDVNDCSVNVNITIASTLPLTANATVTNASGCGNADGSITINNEANGTSPYEYSLDGGANFQTSNIFTGLTSGNYSVVVRDANGCTGQVNTVITEPSNIGASIQFVDPLCNGANDGTITVTNLSGGTSPYQFSIDGINFQTSNTFENLGESNYSITIKDALGCTLVKTTQLIDPPLLALSAMIDQNASCNGSDDGSVTLMATGGTPIYNYKIQNTSFSSNTIYGGLTAGTYTFTVMDLNGCTATVQATITEPNAIILAASVTDHVTCNGGNDGVIESSATGGNGPHTFSIDGTNFQNASTFTGLVAGNYTLTAKDASNCTTSSNITIIEPDIISLQSNITSVSCHGETNGAIHVSAVGGNGSIEYSLDGTNFTSSGNFVGLGAGTYTVTAKDESMCIVTSSITVPEPDVLKLLFEKVDITCKGVNDGQIAGFAQGGTSPYQFSLDGNSFQSTPFSELSPGHYTLTVKDAQNCTATKDVTIDEPDLLVASVNSILNVTCNGGNNGSAQVSVVGGSSPYTYSLDGQVFNNSIDLSALSADNYQLTVRDANLCQSVVDFSVSEPTEISVTATSNTLLCAGDNTGEINVTASGGTGSLMYSIDGANFQSSNVFTGLSANSYTVTVRDANSCDKTTNIDIVAPPTLVITATLIDQNTISASATGGTQPYQYSIDGSTFQASSAFSDLANGTFTITAKDANGCTAATEQTLIVTAIDNPTNLTSVKTYPNPVTDFLVLSNIEVDDKISLIDLNGNILESNTVKKSQTEYRKDLSNLKNGVFLIVVQNRFGQLKMKRKVIKQN